ncbi:hypothetical protein Hanom_Chr11g00982831 [Helianthus anomalus]
MLQALFPPRQTLHPTVFYPLRAQVKLRQNYIHPLLLLLFPCRNTLQKHIYL